MSAGGRGRLRACLSVAALLVAGCERETASQEADARSSGKAAAVVDFPESVHADDPAVNAFVLKAIDACLAEDYDAFRLLWTALEQPLGEQEFRKGFAATRKVAILELAKRRTRADEIVYVVHCLVEFEPGAVPEPTRDIVMLLRKENDKWRIAKAPSKETQALKAKYAARNGTASNGIADAGATGTGLTDADTNAMTTAGATQP